MGIRDITHFNQIMNIKEMLDTNLSQISLFTHIIMNLIYLFQLEDGEEYTYHAPTQSPINPPYKEACELRRSDKLCKPTSSTDGQEDDKTCSTEGTADKLSDLSIK